MKKKYSFLEIIQIITLLILFGLKLIPRLQYTFAGTFWSLAYQGLFAMWLFSTILQSGSWFRVLFSYYKNWMLWIVFLLMGFLLFPNTQLGFLSLNLTFWEPMLIYFYYSEIREDYRITRLVSTIAVFFLIFGLLQSIQSVNVNELAAREASSGHTSEDAVLTGNYSFTATLSILLPVAYTFLFSQRKKYEKVIAASFVVLTFVFIMRCNLMVSILCMFVTVPLYLVFGGTKHPNSKRLLIGIFIVISIFPLMGLFKNLLIQAVTLLGDVIGSDEITKKVFQLTALLNGTMVGNVASRFDLDLIALRTFLRNPIIGIGPQNNANIYFKTYLGFHATLFDDIARYGVIGMSIMIGVYKRFFTVALSEVSEGLCVKCIKTSLITFILISMLNPTISANVGIALFFIVPSLMNEIGGRKSEE